MESRMKRYFILFSLLISCFLGLQGVESQAGQKNHPQEYVIGVDLHDTYLSRDIPGFGWALASIYLKAPNKIELFLLSLKSVAVILAAREIAKEPEASGSPRYVMKKLSAKYPALKTITEEVLQASYVVLHQPNPKMVSLINELKAKGYPVIAVSNISQEGLDAQRATYPEAFIEFDDFFISDYPRTVSVKGEEILIPKKPKKEFYTILREKLLNSSELYKNKPMIFIDDRQDFIEGAEKADVNMQGIRFQNVDQLRRDLEEKGILEPKAFKPQEAAAVSLTN